MELLLEITGWAGAAVILGAYLTVSMGWLKAGRGFQVANLLGACAFLVNGAFHQAWPSVTTNAAWLIISTVALVRMRSEAQPAVASGDSPGIQLPGVPVTTSQIFAAEPAAHFEDSVPACGDLETHPRWSAPPDQPR